MGESMIMGVYMGVDVYVDVNKGVSVSFAEAVFGDELRLDGVGFEEEEVFPGKDMRPDVCERVEMVVGVKNSSLVSKFSFEEI